MQHPQFHDEVTEGLAAIGRPKLAEWTGKDRRSDMTYLGVRVPDRRKLARKGFSFYDRPDEEVLAIWDDLFMHSPVGDVLFCALDYLRLRVKKDAPPEVWATIRHWVERVDNWAHSDDLSWIYSYVLEANFDLVHKELLSWNKQESLWPKRISIVSLIHYTGNNAVFLAPEVVLPMVERCIADHRYYMQKATDWVLREMHRQYPQEIEDFLTTHLSTIGGSALTRSIERMDKDQRNWWRDQRKLTISS